LYRIYPVKELLSQRFHLNIENLYEFCGNPNESATHLFFLIVFIQKCFGWMFQISFLNCLKHVYELSFLMYFFFVVQDNVDSKSTMCFLIQLFILLGKYHIHVKKWVKAKPSLYERD